MTMPAGRSLRRFAAGVCLVAIAAAFALVATLAICAELLSGDATAAVLETRGRLGEARAVAVWQDDRSRFAEVALHNDRGEAVAELLLRRPLRLRADHRVLLTYTGERTGAQILDLIPARDDLVLAAVQYPFTRPRGRWRKLLTVLEVRRAALRTVAGGLLAVDYLVRDERLEPTRFLLLGASVGSIFATLHGAMDERIPSVLIVHGGGALPTLLRASMERSVPGWLLPVAVRIARIPVDSFDPMRYVARISPRQLVVVAARQDRLFPPAGSQAFFARAGEPKRLLWTDTSHVGARQAEIVDEILRLLAGYLNG